MPKKPSPTKRIIKLLASKKKTVVFLFSLVLLTATADITVPFISQKLIDTLIQFFKNGGAPPTNVLIFSSLGILAATIFAQVVKSVYDYNIFITVTKLEDEVRLAAFEKYLRLHAIFHHGSSSGQIIGRIERGTTAIYSILGDIIGQNLLPPLVTFTGVFLALLFKNSWIAMTVILPFPVYLLAIRTLSERIYEIEKKSNDEFEAVSRDGYDVASNVLTVKKFSQEHPEAMNYSELLNKARITQYSGERLWSIMGNVQSVIATLGRISVIVFAGFLVINGKSTIGEFVLYITLQNMAYGPLWQLSNVLPRLRRNSSRVERMFNLLDEPVRVLDKPNAAALPYFESSIEFKNVSFRYSEEGGWALKNINLKIPARTTVALVGRSGSGKTTFINLLLRSYDPQRGKILIDGHDVRDVTQESLRNQIAVVPQEVDLFSRTISENIAYGKPDVDHHEIAKAAKTALAHDFIIKMGKGYDTLVGERGVRLSGGERQRIGIARAVLRDPKILILDEATSHLDTESERLIQKATGVLIKNRTSFIIAHRLSTVLHADVILVFKDGEIEAAGTHSALLKISPTYKKLHSLQFSEPGAE